MEETKKCKHCQSDIPIKAKVCPNCKKKQGGIIKWIIIAIIVLIILGAIFGGSSDSETSTERDMEAQSINTPSSPLDDDIIDVDIDDCHVKYLKHEFIENSIGEDCIAIYYEFTNNDDEPRAFDYVVGEKCFQDGIELETSWFHVNDESHDSSAEIKQGKTVTVCSGFVLRDKTTEIELEVSPWITLKDEPSDKMILSLK